VVADIADEDSRVAMSVGRDGSEGEHGVVFIVDERGDGVGCCGQQFGMVFVEAFRRAAR
jgi:hypothetical protein